MKNIIHDSMNENCAVTSHTLADFESELPRWCKGCGDHGVLTGIQRALKKNNIDPENVVSVSGIGCSSRLPHYLRTYGFHGLHGRALPIATGVRLARPESHVLVVMGDGDCFSIGGNHWLHAIRYNINVVALVLDNNIYALTKKQASPTTPDGQLTNTTPRGTYLEPMNPLSVVMGMTNVSFLAQSATWLPNHLDATIEKAWSHHGLSFVRILQRCPVYMPQGFGDGGKNYPVVLLENEQGIPIDQTALLRGPAQPHDHTDIHAAQEVAHTSEPAPMGLIYQNERLPAYEDIRFSRTDKPRDRSDFLRRLDGTLDKFAV
ncbi:thiamine pyrophosphate-dependent enzyme [Novipirellula artificiosorum]|uniref:2-oxoglutarate oxidoreductase subunit KorB n=1 Tax=Novipirellula artificiosorum TaxID=2528016 RepID=A0A5C6D7X5_9BACT|nr:thiamine pyrophosphate-dependent enzyme [Novipirellula artificiosorum]TWU31954.1 2-oxoglutarate oxidoreductase subunit KorB [Novipirellula artificiosorum]